MCQPKTILGDSNNVIWFILESFEYLLNYLRDLIGHINTQFYSPPFNHMTSDDTGFESINTKFATIPFHEKHVLKYYLLIFLIQYFNESNLYIFCYQRSWAVLECANHHIKRIQVSTYCLQ